MTGGPLSCGGGDGDELGKELRQNNPPRPDSTLDCWKQNRRLNSTIMFTKLAKAVPLLQPSTHGPVQCLLQQQRYKALRQFLQNAQQQRRPATTIAQYTRYLPRTQQTCKSTKQLLQSLQRQRRHASNGARYGTYPPGTSVWTKASDLWSEYPFSVTIALIVIVGSTAIIIYQLYYYQTFVIGAFHTFPEEVAKPLRKAIYYTNIDLNPPWALRYYKEAISKAMELHMDPGSDEFLGIYIQLAAMFEKANHFQKSIEVLERIRTDCMGWLDRNGTKPGNEAKRTRLLGKTVQLSVKLGELYSGQHVLDLAMAEAHLVYAVETALKEQIRREKEGVKPDEGDWMTAEELGGNFETLGHHYEAKNQFHLAGPLFLQALNQCPPTTCHAAVLSKFFIPPVITLLMLR